MFLKPFALRTSHPIGGMSDYSDYVLLCEALDEIERCLGRYHIKERCAELLDDHRRELGFYKRHDCDGLLREGFIDSEEYEMWKRVWSVERDVKANAAIAESEPDLSINLGSEKIYTEWAVK